MVLPPHLIAPGGDGALPVFDPPDWYWQVGRVSMLVFLLLSVLSPRRSSSGPSTIRAPVSGT